jgi:hypothetical protein
MDDHPSESWNAAAKGSKSPTPPPPPGSPGWAKPPQQGGKRGLLLGEVGLLMDIRERLDMLLSEQRQTNQLLTQLVQRQAP